MRKQGRRRARVVPRPAIGPGGPLPSGVRGRRITAAFSVLLLLAVARFTIPRAAAEAYLAAVPGSLQAHGLIVGPEPTDVDLQQLAQSARIGGVVNMGSPSVAEQATTAALHLPYVYIPNPTGGSLSWPQLRVLVTFMRFHTVGGDSVYLHDCDCNSGQAASTAAMLLIMHGASWRGSTIAGLGAIAGAQWRAIRQLDSALHPGHGTLAGNPYSAARGYAW